MAVATLPVLSHPQFPQAFVSATRNFMQQVLGECAFSDEHCDCRERAVVHHLGTDFDYCLRHFKAVTRG